MDVNIANTSMSSFKKDNQSTLVDKSANIASESVAAEDISKTGESSRVEKVNQATKVDSEELQHAVDNIAASMNVIQKGLAFKVDEDSGVQVVKVIDVKSGDLIRQIPNEEALDLSQKLSEAAGLLMKIEV